MEQWVIGEVAVSAHPDALRTKVVLDSETLAKRVNVSLIDGSRTLKPVIPLVWVARDPWGHTLLEGLKGLRRGDLWHLDLVLNTFFLDVK
jgi:hypothetical protein